MREESPGHPASLVPTHHPLKSTQQIFHEHLLPHAALDPPLAPLHQAPRELSPMQTQQSPAPGQARQGCHDPGLAQLTRVP